jgi:hypothetical protein
LTEPPPKLHKSPSSWPGLVPTGHVFLASQEDVDARHKGYQPLMTLPVLVNRFERASAKTISPGSSFGVLTLKYCFDFAKFALKAILFLGALSAILLIAFHEHLIDNIYKNVEDLTDGEMPTTVTSYPSGPEVASIIGGSGQGLNCSLPRGFDVLFDGSPDANNIWFANDFDRPACFTIYAIGTVWQPTTTPRMIAIGFCKIRLFDYANTCEAKPKLEVKPRVQIQSAANRIPKNSWPA